MEFNTSQSEQKILQFWKDNDIFEKFRKKNQGKKRWSFLDGPITANNPMGVHHAWGRSYKDIFQRYKAMQGFDQRFQNGFDCQGLWVEVEVEKELGFKSKKDIEGYGIDKFAEKCKERVEKYSAIQTQQSIRLGQWMDWQNSYYTMSEENNYAIWNFLKVCKEKDLLYKGHDSVPWCPRCGTAISQHEILTEEYKEIKHKTIFFRLKVKNASENIYLLAWTTTPWTLPGNVALAVNPDLEYARIASGQETYILLKEKANLIEKGEIKETLKGKELEGIEYEGLFDDFDGIKDAMKNNNHKVVLWKDVNIEDGTGVVHIAPGCGAEDFQLGKELRLPVIDLSDNESNYRKGFGGLVGKFVGSEEVREWIFNDLESKGAVFKIEDYSHRYPTCWRCKTELIFRVVDEWYISMEKLRKQLIKSAKKIKWIPSFGLERELDWLGNMHDWLISKKRYWGLALPIFECQCKNFEVIGSKKELQERAVSGWKEFSSHSPHRPWVDEIKIKCSKCGKEVPRIKDVGNPWLDAGIVPFSTMPEDWFPADFVCESFPGQFKNWFYSLIVMSTVLKGQGPMKTVFGYASVKDEKGDEMHKSKGNAVWFDDAVEKIGADVMRFMYAKQNPAFDLKFGYNAAKEIKRKLLVLYNTYTFFETYVSKNEFPIIDSKASNSGNVLDKWIISRFNNLIQKTTENLDECDVSAAALAIEDFFINDLSLWYVRRSRERLHLGHTEREATIKVFYHVLLNLLKLIAPIMPFSAEEIYQRLRIKNMPESIHLFDWPKADKKKIDKNLEEKMERAREIVAVALAERAKSGIKVRQPLLDLAIKEKFLEGEEEILSLIKDEVNVKNVIFNLNIKGETELNLEITEELKREGEKRELVRNFKNLRKKIGLSAGELAERVFLSGAFELIDEKLLKEIGAKNLEKTENFEGDIKGEIEISGIKIIIGIKK